MNSRSFALGLALASSIAFVGPARADMPPPDGYVEKCTVANQETPATECLACGSGHFYNGRCSKLLTPYCFGNVCQSYGATVFTEVWCRTRSERQVAVPPEILTAVGNYSTVPDGGASTAPSNCPAYPPPDAGIVLASPDAQATGGQGGASAVGGSTAMASGTGGQGGPTSLAGGAALAVTGGSSAAGGSVAVVGGSVDQGGVSAVGGASLASAGAAGVTGSRGTDKPSDSSGCAVGGWLSAKALAPWLLAGLFGAIVTLARRRRH
jgi:hypothetical protein